MTTLLPLGSVVRLHHGKQKVMITTRFPLYNNQGTIGYFDYAGSVLIPLVEGAKVLSQALADDAVKFPANCRSVVGNKELMAKNNY